jgi:hypothetical protein
MIVIIITDALIIITACLGLYGIKKSKPGLLFLFTILVGFFCIVLVGGGILANYAPGVMGDADKVCGSGTPEDQWIIDVKNITNASSIFCTPDCPCDLQDLSAYN